MKLPAPARFLPEGRAGQFLALGLPPVLAAALLFGLLIPAWQSYQAAGRQLAARQQEIAQILAMRQRIPVLRQTLAMLRASARDRGIFLAGATDEIAGANLQSALESLAAQCHANLTASEMAPPGSAAGLRPIAITVDLTADWNSFIALLQAIALARPRMAVTALVINAPPDGSGALQISLTVTAFRPT